MKGRTLCHPPGTGPVPRTLSWGTASYTDLWVLWECSHLIVPIDEDCNHLWIDALSRQQGAQHPGERLRGLSTQSQWAQAAQQKSMDRLGWEKGHMVREQDLLPLGSSLSHGQGPCNLSKQVCPCCPCNPRRRLDPASGMK